MIKKASIKLNRIKYQTYDYEQWNQYFIKNKELQENVIEAINSSENLLVEELELFPSLKKFSLGESSSASSYRQKVAQTNNENFIQAIDHFIAEENNHSYFLQLILKANSQELLETTSLDNIFRKLRKNFGLITKVNILLTAEIIALSYYGLVHDITSNQMLKQVCQQMLHDETAHLAFQAYNNKSFGKKSILKNYLRHGFMFATVTSVYMSERQLFKTNGLSYSHLLKQSHNLLNEVINLENS